MKTPTRKRTPKSLPPAVSDLVAEGGNILASDDATKLTITSAEMVSDSAKSSSKATRPPQAKQRTAATIR